MKNIELSIIIVNYNGKEYLKNCFNSIEKYCSKVNHEIIVVDNLSTDGSQDYIKQNFPYVHLIESKENTGFAKGNNIGVRKAQGEVILLLNNDTILCDDFTPILEEVKKDDVGTATIKMLNGDKKYTPSFGRFPTPFGLLRIANMNDNREDLVSGNFIKKVYDMDWISGSFLLVTKEDWDQVGGLDEDYFMYVEDVDFCKKLQNLGKKMLFYPAYSYIHFVGFNPSRELKLINGYKIYSKKHFNVVNATLAKICLHINYVYKRIFKNIR